MKILSKCGELVLSASLFLLLSTIPRPSYAQNVGDVSSDPPTMTTHTLSTTSTQSLSMSVHIASTSSPHTTLSTLTTHMAAVPSHLPADQADPEEETNENVFNYYFLILAVFGVFVAVGLWWIRRRRILQKERMRLSGQNALAQDLDGWVGTRRWMHGAWRNNQQAAHVGRVEGLNEHGEAPPPYQLNDVAPATAGVPQDSASGLTIPLRTLSRDRIETMHPPDYQPADNRRNSTSTRPESATPRATSPVTADIQPDGSTGNLLAHTSPQPKA